MKKLLIAEHHPVIAEKIAAAVQCRWKPFIAETGPEAEALLTELHPTALVIDLHLPPKGGLNVLVACKDKLPPQVVGLTTSVAPAIVDQATAAGVTRLIQIPFTTNALDL